VIFGDYDVDGVTGAAVLWHVLRAIAPAADVRTYVPHRIDEGYGLNVPALRRFAEDGSKLVVSVDCGVSGHAAALEARTLGLDLIVTDHHALGPEGTLPDAFAVVHPLASDAAYPFAELCGAGVAFKLAWRLATRWCGSERVGASLQRRLLELLPLVALGTVADVVPLVGENRVLASFGLRLMAETTNVGLRALIEASELGDRPIDAETVAFVLGPRLNACGRLGHADDAVELLTTDDPARALEWILGQPPSAELDRGTGRLAVHHALQRP